jgi:NAD(P)-dependent dehydrogenase (short-subunit alcohol dehydrogenase family)
MEKLKQRPRSSNILITGVSTGIGHDSARAFLARGYKVFGTVRTAADASRLVSALGPRFEPLVVDVTDAAAVAREVGALTERLGDGDLGGLINNAGIALPGPLSEQSFDQIRRIFEVNLFGALAVTRACLPLLGMRTGHRSAPGTIVNISSGAGKISIPFLGAYVASKHALEGMSNSLRRGLMPWDIKVVVVGPGNVKTPIWEKTGGEESYDHTAYGPVFRNFVRFMFAGAKTGMTADEIAGLLVRIMESDAPKVRYAPVAQRFTNWTLPRLLPDRQMDRMLFKALGMKRLG